MRQNHSRHNRTTRAAVSRNHYHNWLLKSSEDLDNIIKKAHHLQARIRKLEQQEGIGRFHGCQKGNKATKHFSPSDWVPREVIRRRIDENKCAKCGSKEHQFIQCKSGTYVQETKEEFQSRTTGILPKEATDIPKLEKKSKGCKIGSPEQLKQPSPMDTDEDMDTCYTTSHTPDPQPHTSKEVHRKLRQYPDWVEQLPNEIEKQKWKDSINESRQRFFKGGSKIFNRPYPGWLQQIKNQQDKEYWKDALDKLRDITPLAVLPTREENLKQDFLQWKLARQKEVEEYTYQYDSDNESNKAVFAAEISNTVPKWTDGEREIIYDTDIEEDTSIKADKPQ